MSLPRQEKMSDEEKEKTLLELYTEGKQEQEREKAYKELLGDSDDDESFKKYVESQKEPVQNEFERGAEHNSNTSKYRPRGDFTPDENRKKDLRRGRTGRTDVAYDLRF